MPFAEKRTVYWVAPHAAGKQRLMAMLHGVCNPPGYACGLWAEDAKDLGFLVCPTGNGSCGKAMYDAPTWTEPDTAIDADLELSIDAVEKVVPGELAREQAILLGFSRGAYVSVKIAAAHPGRWPYLVLIEADAKPSAEQLKKSGVRAVAFLAGEIGSQLAGEKKTVASLAAAGFPAKLWVMPKAGHHYSNDIGALLREAIAWFDTHG
jgi:predicted esterase